MRYFSKIILISFLLSIPLLAYSADGIKIKDRVVIDGEYLRLKDIAIPREEIPIWDEIKNIPLINIQGFPTVMTLDGDRLREILTQKISLNFASKCEIPENIRIYRGETVLDKIKLTLIILRFVNDNTFYLKGEKKVRDISTPEYIVLGKGEKLAIHLIGNRISPGYNSISFVVTKEGKKLRTRPGKFFLDVWTEVPCASVPLNRGDVLTPDKITFVKKNLAYLPKDIWDGRSGPWRVKIPIGRLQEISLSRLEPLPTIQKGQKIKLIFDGKGVYLGVVAQSLEDGKIGDIIRVMNLQSKKIVYARVIDKNIVKVE
jgi:flagella basal body P-ring formation protein FlgA